MSAYQVNRDTCLSRNQFQRLFFSSFATSEHRRALLSF